MAAAVGRVPPVARQHRRSTIVLIDAIDWAVKENGDRSSRFYRKLDASKVAVMGQSCGGLQALAVSGDPRVTTTVVMNSGAFRPAPARRHSRRARATSRASPACMDRWPTSSVARPTSPTRTRKTISRASPPCRCSRRISTSGTAAPIGSRAAAGSARWRSPGWTISSRAAPRPRNGSSAPTAGLCTEPVWTVQKKGMR